MTWFYANHPLLKVQGNEILFSMPLNEIHSAYCVLEREFRLFLLQWKD